MKKNLIIMLMLAIASVCFDASAVKFEPITVTNMAGKQVTLSPDAPCMVTIYWDKCHWCYKVMDKIREEEKKVRDDAAEEMSVAFELWKVPNYVVAYYHTQEEKQQTIQRFKDNGWDTSRLLFLKGAENLSKFLAKYNISNVPVIMVVNDKNEVTETIVGDKYNLDESLYRIMLNLLY